MATPEEEVRPDAPTSDADVVRDLLSGGFGNESPLFSAVSQNQTEELKALLETKAEDVNALVDAKLCRMNPLHLACFRSQPECVRLLLDAGADPNVPSSIGMPPVLFVANNTSTEADTLKMYQMLEKAGAKVAVISPGKSTPLSFACLKGFNEVADWLIDQGLPVDLQDRNGWSPMHCAATQGHDLCVCVLLAAGASTDLQDKDQRTPLWCAALFGFEDIVGRLLSVGADHTLPDMSGRTPLHIAASQGHTCCVQQLLDAGADPSYKTVNGKTALDLAKNDLVKQMIREASSENDDALVFLLRKMKMTKYLTDLVEAEMDLEMLAVSTPEELEEIGVPAPDNVALLRCGKALWARIEQMQQHSSGEAASAAIPDDFACCEGAAEGAEADPPAESSPGETKRASWV